MRESKRSAGKLHDFEAFLAVIEAGNLTRAAVKLGRSLQSVSRSLSALEDQVGAVLIRRTTRTARPTEAGLVFYQRVSAAMRDIHAAAAELRHGTATLRGQVRVAAPPQLAGALVVPAMHGFAKRHPSVHFALKLHDAETPLIPSDVDVIVRVGKLPASPLRAKKLGVVRRALIASPSYFARRDRPTRPQDLARHAMLFQRTGPDARSWSLTGPDGQTTRFAVKPAFVCDDAHVLLEAAIAGMGVALVPRYQARDALARGACELVLDGHAPTPLPVNAIWATSPKLPARAARFVEWLARRVKKELR